MQNAVPVAPSLRSEQRSYMNMGTHDAPIWRLVGEGFANFETSANPITQDRHYVHEKSARNYSVGNAPSIAYELDEMPTDPVALAVATIHDEEKVGNAAVVDIVNVKMFRLGKAPGTYFAKRRSWSVVPDSEAAGNGGEVYGYSGNFNALGDAVLGDWTVDNAGGFESGSFAARPEIVAPDAPTAVSATPGDGMAVITFTPPVNNGGSEIISYTATALSGVSGVSVTATESPITISGLTNGTSYTVTVVATNDVGNSVASTPATVTPTA